jgi:hypothetical protein
MTIFFKPCSVVIISAGQGRQKPICSDGKGAAVDDRLVMKSAKSIRFLLWCVVLLNRYTSVDGTDRFLGIVRQLLLSKDTTEKVKQGLFRVLQGRRHCGHEIAEGIPLPPSMMVTTPPNARMLTKLIPDFAGNVGSSSSSTSLMQGRRLRFWNQFLRHTPTDIYTFIAMISLVSMVQRRMDTLLHGAKNSLEGLVWRNDRYLQWNVGMLVLVGIAYLWFQDSTWIRFACSSAVGCVVVAMMAHYQLQFHLARRTATNEANVDSHELNEAITTTTFSRDEAYSTEPFMQTTLSSTDCAGELVDALEADKNESALSMQASAFELGVTEPKSEEIETSVAKEHLPIASQRLTDHLKNVQSMMRSLVATLPAIRTKSTLTTASLNQVKSSNDDSVPDMSAISSEPTIPVDLHQYAFSGDRDGLSKIAFLPKNPKTTAEGLVAAAAGMIIVVVHAFGFPLVPLLHDSVASILTWAVGSQLYDRLISLGKTKFDSSAPNADSPSFDKPLLTANLAASEAELARHFDCPHIGIPIDELVQIANKKRWERVLSREPDGNSLEQEPSAREDHSKGDTFGTSTNPPFETIEVAISSSPLEDHPPEGPVEVSVVQTQYFPPVQQLLRALLVGGGATVASGTKNNT